MNMLSKQPIYGVDYIHCFNCGRTVQNKKAISTNGHSWICSCGWFKNIWSCKVA
jgi:ribosomal protein S26